MQAIENIITLCNERTPELTNEAQDLLDTYNEYSEYLSNNNTRIDSAFEHVHDTINEYIHTKESNAHFAQTSFGAEDFEWDAQEMMMVRCMSAMSCAEAQVMISAFDSFY